MFNDGGGFLASGSPREPLQVAMAESAAAAAPGGVAAPLKGGAGSHPLTGSVWTRLLETFFASTSETKSTS